MRYAINSAGETIELKDEQSAVRFLGMEIRENELRQFADDFTALLREKGITTEGKHFASMIQPFYTTERLLFFARTEFSSSSQAVKLANELMKHPEILANREKTEFLQSIFPDDSSGRHRWFFLNVGYIAFERNLFDCKRINMKLAEPIPYAKFMQELQEQLITQDDMDSADLCPRFQLKTNGISLQDAKMLVRIAFDRDLSQGQASVFDKTISDIVQQYMQKKGYAFKDKTSNRATTCLSVINDNNRNIYPVYQAVKNCIKKAYKDAYGICYKGNRITAHLNENQELTIYVSGTDDKPQFIAGGQTYFSLDTLREALINQTVLRETRWFAEKVRPNIQSRCFSKVETSYPKDEIGWTKKPRKKYTRKKPNPERN